ncbi:coiled-coil domain-containing protein 96 [Tribolium madens]|uniref:coiled-coil domain-containing protein 96 n=1 Tax=Tribolium madens TaxID=41895 RepID=UPI001CF74AF0|nr:coiled-coil domain-containing protein 96 [Tribolium madens]
MSADEVSFDTRNATEENLTENESPETEALQEEGQVEAVEEQEILDVINVPENEENNYTAEVQENVDEINVEIEGQTNVVEGDDKADIKQEETSVPPAVEEMEESEVVKEDNEQAVQIDVEDKISENKSAVDVEGVDEKVEKKVEKGLKNGAEEYDFEHLVEPDAVSEMSFALLPEEVPKFVEPSKDTLVEPVEIEVPKKKKKVKKKKIRPIVARRDSDYSSIRISGSQSLIITGDFAMAQTGSKPLLPSLISEATEEEVEDEEDEEVEDEEIKEMTEAERMEYFQKYDRLSKEHDEEKLKNDEFLRRLANYYKRKKMYHVLHEGKVQLDAQKKYEKQLDDYSIQAELSKKEQLALQMEIADLKQKCTIQERETVEAFEKLQHEEFEVGKDIINSEAGRGHEEKFIERYLKRQRIQLNNLIKIRYDYIKIRNKLNETQDALNAIDNLGSNLHLIDYEQLKLDNRNLQDKLEERDLELTRVRRKCQNAVQILAHRREKNAALDADITYLNERLEGVSGEYEDVREQLNQLKMERDSYRAATNKIIANSGLLSRPTLLRDLSNTMDEMEELGKKLEKTKRECIAVSNKVKKIRENMASETKMNKIRLIMEGKQLSASFSGASLSDIMVGTVAG